MEKLPLEGVKVGIFVENGYEDLELHYPLLRFRETGAKTFLIGPKRGENYKGKFSYTVNSDCSIDDIKASDLDALIIPGGLVPDRLRTNRRFIDLVDELLKSDKLVATICHGASLLVNAEKKLLMGRTITCHKDIIDDVLQGGANFIDQEVVLDKNLITSRTLDDLPAFCRVIIRRLK